MQQAVQYFHPVKDLELVGISSRPDIHFKCGRDIQLLIDIDMSLMVRNYLMSYFAKFS